jgi:hypothetical protein
MGSDWTPNGAFKQLNVGGQFTGEIKAISGVGRRLDLIGVGKGGHLHHKSWDGESWVGWTSIGPSCIGTPEAVRLDQSRLDVYFIGAASFLTFLVISKTNPQLIWR